MQGISFSCFCRFSSLSSTENRKLDTQSGEQSARVQKRKQTEDEHMHKTNTPVLGINQFSHASAWSNVALQGQKLTYNRVKRQCIQKRSFRIPWTSEILCVTRSQPMTAKKKRERQTDKQTDTSTEKFTRVRAHLHESSIRNIVQHFVEHREDLSIALDKLPQQIKVGLQISRTLRIQDTFY